MAFERKWAAVPPQAFTADGNQFGLVTVASTAGFRVKQSAYLKNTAGTKLAVQVKRVNSPTQLVVGAIDNKIASWVPLDLTSWTVASGASIGAEEANKNDVPEKDHYSAIYEGDPVVADRVIFVDQYGNFYDSNNPLPIAFDGTVQIGNVSIVDQTSGTPVKVNPDGSINVIVESIPSTNSTVVSKYNEITAVPAGATTQIVSYTVPAGKQAVLQRCPVSGENIARYDLLINGQVQDTIRTNFGGDLTGMFDFSSGNDSGLVLNAGNTVAIQVLHNRPFTGSFEARIQVLEIIL